MSPLNFAAVLHEADLAKYPPVIRGPERKRGGLQSRYDTLHQLLSDVEADVEAKGIVLTPLEHESHSGSIIREPFLYGGIQYNGSKKADYPIDSIKGRKTTKYYHLTIDRMENGRYEPVAYVL